MKHWGIDEGDIFLLKCENIISIEPSGNGEFIISEACDRWYKQKYSKAEMIELLKEAIEYIESLDSND